MSEGRNVVVSGHIIEAHRFDLYLPPGAYRINLGDGRIIITLCEQVISHLPSELLGMRYMKFADGGEWCFMDDKS